MPNFEEMIFDTRLMSFKQYLPGLIDTSENGRKQYEADLVSIGYDQVKVSQFLGGRASLARELLLGQMPDPESKRKGIYKALNLYGKGHKSQNWVLLDPFKCDLATIAKQDLLLILKLAFYKPGNAYYLEYNVKSKSIRMRPASTCLEGGRIEYTLSGPVMLKVEDASDREAEAQVKDNIQGMVTAMD